MKLDLSFVVLHGRVPFLDPVQLDSIRSKATVRLSSTLRIRSRWSCVLAISYMAVTTTSNLPWGRQRS